MGYSPESPVLSYYMVSAKYASPSGLPVIDRAFDATVSTVQNVRADHRRACIAVAKKRLRVLLAVEKSVGIRKALAQMVRRSTMKEREVENVQLASIWAALWMV